MDRPAIIIQQRNGHTFIWRFRECDALKVEALIEDQCCQPHPGFEEFHTLDCMAAMREARMLAPQPKANPLWYAGFTFVVGMAYAATRGKR